MLKYRGSTKLESSHSINKKILSTVLYMQQALCDTKCAKISEKLYFSHIIICKQKAQVK